MIMEHWRYDTEVPGEKRISVHLLHQKYHTDYPACMDERTKAYKVLIENLIAKDHLEGLGVNGKIILK
jgi:hypothetical protein